MYLKVLKQGGVTRLYFYESHYEPSGKKGVRGKVRQEMTESLGNLEDLQKIYDDPISHFTQAAKDRTAEKKAERMVTLKLDRGEDMDEYVDDVRNCGYGILNEMYKELELDRFWKYRAEKGETAVDCEAVFRLLVCSHVIFPGSMREAFYGQDRFFEGFGTFALEDVYRALSVFSRNRERLQGWILAHAEKRADPELFRAYHGLQECGEAVQIQRDDLEIGLAYVRETELVEGHFAVCFTAQVLIRLLQGKLEPHFPVEQILSALRSYACTSVDSRGTLYKFLYHDDVVRAWTDTFGRNYSQKYRTRLEVRRLLVY